MKISLHKVTKRPLDFEVTFNKMVFKGNLQYDTDKLILLQAKLSGLLQTDCSVCADEFTKRVDEDIEFFISDGIYKSRSDSLVDVVECFDSIIDMDELLHAEIELIKSDYNNCPECAS